MAHPSSGKSEISLDPIDNHDTRHIRQSQEDGH